MTEKTTRSIVCDNCGAELIRETKNPAEYALLLKAVNVGVNKTGIVHAIKVYPPIEHDMHFCNEKCLIEWLED